MPRSLGGVPRRLGLSAYFAYSGMALSNAWAGSGMDDKVARLAMAAVVEKIALRCASAGCCVSISVFVMIAEFMGDAPFSANDQPSAGPQ